MSKVLELELRIENIIVSWLRNSIILIFTILLFQTILGILTVISGAQIVLASLHQLGSIFLITSTIFLLYKNS